MTKSWNRGFTLTELLVSLSIVAILATMAIPAYKNYMIKVRRSDAKVALMEFSMAMERQYITDNTYAATATAALVYQDVSDEGFYTLSFGTITTTGFILYAFPTGVQIDDTECGAFRLDQLGTQGISGTGSVSTCW